MSTWNDENRWYARLMKPLPPGAGRTARVEWRTTADRKARAQQLAESAGQPLSTWLDTLVDRARK